MDPVKPNDTTNQMGGMPQSAPSVTPVAPTASAAMPPSGMSTNDATTQVMPQAGVPAPAMPASASVPAEPAMPAMPTPNDAPAVMVAPAEPTAPVVPAMSQPTPMASPMEPAVPSAPAMPAVPAETTGGGQ